MNVPTNAELHEQAKGQDPYTVIRNWLDRHVDPPNAWTPSRDYWLDWATSNLLADPEVRAWFSVKKTPTSPSTQGGVLKSPTGTCWGFEDGLDGFDIHTDKCPNVGKSWTHGSNCINHKTWHGPYPSWAQR